MNVVTRRRFLLASAGAGAAAAGAGAVSWSQLLQRAQTDPLPPGQKILVMVTLYGGNDGLNTVIPYSDAAYHHARPELAYQAGEVLVLDDQFGLNPALSGLLQLWNRRQLAIVRGVGYPKPDHSHFRSMDIWQTGSPDTPVPTGWLGRWLDSAGDDPLRAVSLGATLPPLAVGAKAAAASLPAGRLLKLPPALADAAALLARVDRTDGSLATAVRASYQAERTVAARFDSVLGAPGSRPPTSNALASQLDVVAQAIVAGVPTRAWSVSLGNFDTHADEKGAQQSLLGDLDTAVSRFFAALGSHPNGQGVVMVIYSEFGRRVRANASQGTDHGTAAPVFVVGPNVNAGFHGQQPSLTDLDNGDLKATVDFRALYGELLASVLATDPHRVLSTVPTPLGVLHG